MVNVEPYDSIDDIDCRWYIADRGLVFGKDLEKELKAYYKELQEFDTEEEIGGEKQENE